MLVELSAAVGQEQPLGNGGFEAPNQSQTSEMTKDEFLQLMRFPIEWDSLGMYPRELFEAQIARDERGSEHDRNGAFHWWLREGPTKHQAELLRRLSHLDPDPLLGQDMRRYLDDSQLPPGYVVRD